MQDKQQQKSFLDFISIQIWRKILFYPNANKVFNQLILQLIK